MNPWFHVDSAGKNGLRKNRASFMGVCCGLLVFLSGSVALAQTQYPSTATPPQNYYSQENYRYADSAPAYSSQNTTTTNANSNTTTPQYPPAYYTPAEQAASQPTSTQYQQPAAQYQASPQYQQPTTAPYPTTSQYQSTTSYQTPPYQEPQYRVAQQPAVSQPVVQQPTTTTYQPTPQYQAAPYPTTQTPSQYPSTQYPSTTSPSNQYQQQYTAPASSSDPIEQARYIQPSVEPLNSGAQPPAYLRSTPTPDGSSPYSSPSSYGSAAGSPNGSSASGSGDSARGSLSASSTASIEGKTVVDIRIVGNRSVKNERIASMIRTRKGRTFSGEVLQHDVREMSRSGLFVNVKPSYQETPDGPIVIFEVIERPILNSIKFVGAKKIKRKTLLKESGLKEGDAADPFRVEEARRSLEQYYHDKGFAQARVSIYKGSKPEDRDAVFVINEGTKQKILWTKFEGNEIESDARLKTQIESKEGILWFINGEFNYEKLEMDKEKLLAYYRGLGFFDASIDSEVTFTSDTWAMITFVINEGVRYKVRNTNFLGNKIYREDQLRNDLKLLSGEYFNQNKMNADLNSTRDLYGRVGYVFADIKAEPRFLEEPGTLDLVYSIKEGDQYKIGLIDIRIKGDGEVPRTKKTVVLDRLSQGPGDIIDIREIRSSEVRLKSAGVFASNPATGAVPKILISPPDNLEEMRDPRDSYHDDPQARGQSW